MANTDKTYREWFNELPEPYRSQAIDNAIKQGRRNIDREIASSLSNALDLAITWGETPEGHDYWKKLEDTIRHKRTIKLPEGYVPPNNETNYEIF